MACIKYSGLKGQSVKVNFFTFSKSILKWWVSVGNEFLARDIKKILNFDIFLPILITIVWL